MFALLNRAERRSTAMMDILGVDPEVAMMRGQIPPEELRNIALRCASCENGDDCERWMDNPAVEHEQAPSYCRNKELFERL